MNSDIKNLLVSDTKSIRDAMEAIQQNARGIVLVVSHDGRLAGSLTDGDIRRAILSNTPLSANVTKAMNPSPHVCSLGDEPEDVFQDMTDKRLRLIPVVDQAAKPVGAWEYPDLAAQLGRIAEKPVAAVLMAGGLGSRLGDMTQDTPKPLIEVGGKPILERIVTHLKDSGLQEVTITTRYLAEKIEDHFGSGERLGVNIDYVREEKRLGTAGALKYLQGQVDDAFLVMNADLLTDVDVAGLVRFHRDNDALMTVAVRHFTMQVPYGVVDVKDVEVTSISEKPNMDFFVNAGIYVLEPSVLGYIPTDTYFDITELMQCLLDADKRVVSFPIHERWMDIGRPEDLEAARDLYDSKRSSEV